MEIESPSVVGEPSDCSGEPTDDDIILVGDVLGDPSDEELMNSVFPTTGLGGTNTSTPNTIVLLTGSGNKNSSIPSSIGIQTPSTLLGDGPDDPLSADLPFSNGTDSMTNVHVDAMTSTNSSTSPPRSVVIQSTTLESGPQVMSDDIMVNSQSEMPVSSESNGTLPDTDTNVPVITSANGSPSTSVQLDHSQGGASYSGSRNAIIVTMAVILQ